MNAFEPEVSDKLKERLCKFPDNCIHPSCVCVQEGLIEAETRTLALLRWCIIGLALLVVGVMIYYISL